MEHQHSPTGTGTTTFPLTRPRSSRIEDSIFADSAVDMDATATPPLKTTSGAHDGAQLQPLSPISSSLADRIKRLAAAAWVLEQDEHVSYAKRQHIERNLRHLEEIIDEHGTPEETMQTKSISGHSSPPDVDEQVDSTTETGVWLDESAVFQIHDDLSATVASMRLRQQEQRHLHQLTATKLEAVAQRCLFQEQQLQSLVREAQSLRSENQILGEENDRLRGAVKELHSEASQREVAVSAMTSAVAGLEGWIDDAEKVVAEAQIITPPVRGNRQRRAIVRGKGRFRGRYYVDDEQGGYFPTSPDARDLQDGVKAWIRGFRDVEDACNTPPRKRAKELYSQSLNAEDDDWGEFESPGTAAV